MNKIKCKLCGYDALKFGTVNGYRYPEKYNVFKCEECNSQQINSSEVTNLDLIYNSIYSNAKVVPGYNRYYFYKQNVLKKKNPLKWLAKLEETYNSVLISLKSFSGIKNNEFRILEVGSGLGYLTYSLNNLGYNAIGIDLSSNAVKEATDNFGEYYYCKDFFTIDKQYDLIIMLELIEHVANPNKFIEHAKSLLSEEGKLLITTPALNPKVENLIWRTELPPVHQTWISHRGLEELAFRNQMNIEFLKNRRNLVILKEHLKIENDNYGFLDENYRLNSETNYNSKAYFLQKFLNTAPLSLLKIIRFLLKKERAILSKEIFQYQVLLTKKDD